MIPKKQIKVIRRTKPINDGGFKTDDPAGQSELYIAASVQPTRGKDLELLPEGLHFKTALTLYTQNYTQEDSSTHQPDTIEYRGEEYKIVYVSDWDNSLIPHKKVLVIR